MFIQVKSFCVILFICSIPNLQIHGNKSCESPNCNLKGEFETSCFECDGAIEPNCVHGSKIAAQVDCNDHTKACVTGIDVNGFTHRGCISTDLLAIRFPFGFETCSKNLCNNRIFPSDRFKCYQCQGIHECVTLVDLNSQICNIYMDQCYAYLDKSGVFYRGCLKDDKEGRYLCEQDAARCEVCDENACNSQMVQEMNDASHSRKGVTIYLTFILTFHYIQQAS